jgi:hypothetical protein
MIAMLCATIGIVLLIVGLAALGLLRVLDLIATIQKELGE